MYTFKEACLARLSATIGDEEFLLNTESHKASDTFKEMAKYGLLTTDSQEGRVLKVKR